MSSHEVVYFHVSVLTNSQFAMVVSVCALLSISLVLAEHLQHIHIAYYYLSVFVNLTIIDIIYATLKIWWWHTSAVILCPPRRLCNARHLFVCLIATLHKNYWSDLHDNFTTDVSVDKEELIKFWKSYASGSRSFFMDLSALRHRSFFHNLAHISGQTDRIFMKILLQM